MKLRYKDYEGTKKLWQEITSPHYQATIQSINQSINQYDPTQNIPRYYQDGLVALSLLKNGHFSVAKKLALQAALIDNKYILPYQILAYTHFLTNNRETANQYFLKLINFDNTNKDIYRFLIGVSLYRSKKHTESILYLSQSNKKEIQTDTYRYLILNYIEIKDYEKAVSLRQKILGEKDISRSDYYNYFFNTFYSPYLNNETSIIYKENPILAQMFISNCGSTMTGEDIDICTYGKIGFELINNRLSYNLIPEINKLINKYNNSYFFRILGDIYLINNEKTKAKENYIKALGISLDIKENNYIENKISQL